MNEWIGLLQTFGLATTILIFLGFCFWKAGGWLGENVVKPVVDRYIKLLDALIVSITKQGETLDRMGAHNIQMMSIQERIAKRLSDIHCVREADDREKG